MATAAKVWKWTTEYKLVVWMWPHTGQRAWKFRTPASARLFFARLGSLHYRRWHTRRWCGEEVKDRPQFIWVLVQMLEDLESLGRVTISELVQY